jgi:ubiquinone/menaquinone biosynthesis C-methylase UbiE
MLPPQPASGPSLPIRPPLLGEKTEVDMSDSHRHPLFARLYPRISHASEQRGGAEHRRALLEGTTGRVIEVGSGHGLNFPYYPSTVSELVAVEPEPHLRSLAAAAARDTDLPVRVLDGYAEQLPAQDGDFDVAIASLVLCSVADQAAALREITRVLRPGGQLRFYEHVISNHPRTARVQRTLDATFYPLVSGGCHCARDTAAAIRAAGFDVERERRIAFKPSPIVPAIPHILGTAVRP